jgi:predicted DNA-binding transcriptional regulator AlpA
VNTVFMLMAQYDGLVVIPLRRVCTDYFEHLTQEKLRRKVEEGEIDLPLMRLDESCKAMLGVHLLDLAAYLDSQRTKARNGSPPLPAPLVQPATQVKDLITVNTLALSESPCDLIRLPEVMKLTGVCKSGIYKMMSDGDFPCQVKLGARAVAWVRKDVWDWRQKRIDAKR